MSDTMNRAEVIREALRYARQNCEVPHCGPSELGGGGLCDSCTKGNDALAALDALTREADSLRAENEGFRTLDEKSCTTIYFDLRSELGLGTGDSLVGEVLRLCRLAKQNAAQAERIKALEAAGSAHTCALLSQLVYSSDGDPLDQGALLRLCAAFEAALAPKEAQVNGPVNDPGIIEPDIDLSKCPKCGGPADNGHDRCLPPSPYYCSKCQP